MPCVHAAARAACGRTSIPPKIPNLAESHAYSIARVGRCSAVTKDFAVNWRRPGGIPGLQLKDCRPRRPYSTQVQHGRPCGAVEGVNRGSGLGLAGVGRSRVGEHLKLEAVMLEIWESGNLGISVGTICKSFVGATFQRPLRIAHCALPTADCRPGSLPPSPCLWTVHDTRNVELAPPRVRACQAHTILVRLGLTSLRR